MKHLEVKGRDLYLDGEKVGNLKGYKIPRSGEKNGVAELGLVINVSMTDSNDLKEKEEKAMNYRKVDETIEVLCDCVQERIEDEKERKQEKPEDLINALAQLLSARAQMRAAEKGYREVVYINENKKY